MMRIIDEEEQRYLDKANKAIDEAKKLDAISKALHYIEEQDVCHNH